MSGLLQGVIAAANMHADRPALDLDGAVWNYRDLVGRAAAIAQIIREYAPDEPGLGAVFAHKSLTAYSGVLGTLASGRGYVPLQPAMPPDRTRRMLRLSGCRVVVVGPEAVGLLPSILEDYGESVTVIGPEIASFGRLPARLRDHSFIPASGVPASAALLDPPSVSGDDVAYLLFTSGSTGTPKGIPVTHGNVTAYVTGTLDRYGITPEDRASQTFDLTFDLSVHDLFVTWWAGACLCPLSDRELLAPVRPVRDGRLTLWFSVPSVAMIMSRLRMLKPGIFPDLRLSLFCGEPLPSRTASLWAAAAPSSIVENLYGPTEATIAITAYRWEGESSETVSRHGIAPIGWVFPGQRAEVVDDEGRLVKGPGRGELHLGGTQVVPGYLHDPERTAERFVAIEATDVARWYRTGDMVERDESGCLHFAGRVDDQIKLHGHRIDLLEIDAVLREASGTELAVAVAWPVTEEGVGGIVGFVAGTERVDAASILDRCAERLAPYMVPKRVLTVPELPLNANGKIDRRALGTRLDQLGTNAFDRRADARTV